MTEFDFINLYLNTGETAKTTGETAKTTDIYVIGGKEVIEFFMSPPIKPTKLYITHIINPQFIKRNIQVDTVIPYFSCEYSLNSWSELLSYYHLDNKFNYRCLEYELLPSASSQEEKYINLMDKIITDGYDRLDRTNTGTTGIFGTMMEFDISKYIPLMTTRNIPFRTIVEELLWFCRGDTDNKVLQQRKVKIWDGNSSREFLDKRKLEHYPEGVIGPSYGWQWRHSGAEYNVEWANTSNYTAAQRAQWGGIDQLENVVHLLKTDPFSRRIIMVNYNPSVADNVALPSCHTQVQFYVREVNNISLSAKPKRYLSCKFDMRSSDSLAWSFNCVSYSILTKILALKCDMLPDKLIYTAGDCHIYSDHIDQVMEQTERTIQPEPALHLNPELKNKDWHDMNYTDFELIGYFPHGPLKMNMAI